MRPRERSKRIYAILILAVLALGGLSASGGSRQNSPFVTVENGRFVRDGKPYHYVGTNLWNGMNLGSSGLGGDRARLIRELDRLEKLGITNLRILAGSEGPDNEPWRIVPALQKSPGVYDQDLLNGLDFLLSEMKKRNMVAVMCLGNYWTWSGGFAQYRQWAGAGPIPYVNPEPRNSRGFLSDPDSHKQWVNYFNYVSKFYGDAKAVDYYHGFVRMMVSRYAADPTVMSWELGNEPRGLLHPDTFNSWIDKTSALIKSLDPHHLVTTGSEGDGAEGGLDLVRNHQYAGIDYATVHIWPENAKWYNPKLAAATYWFAISKTKSTLQKDIDLAKKLKKPLVLEEFGLARDNRSFDAETAVTYRDHFYADVFSAVFDAASTGKTLVGANFWAWGGEGRPVSNHANWQPGDPFIGDPAHEPQGWYSVFDDDQSTLEIIRQYAEKFSQIE
jgi:mannan endo-1,4-beta-mannosidase